MEKYVRIKKDDHVDMETELSGLCSKEFQVRVNAFGYPNNYVAYAASILEKAPTILLKARGSAITNLIIASELLRRRHAPLHQISDAGVVQVEDDYEPLEEGLDIVKHARTVPYMQILLSKNELDTTHRGYQAPAEKSQTNNAKSQPQKQQGHNKPSSAKTPTQYDAFNTPYVRKNKKWNNGMRPNKTGRTIHTSANREGRFENGKFRPSPMFKLVPSGALAVQKGKRQGIQQRTPPFPQRGKGAQLYNTQQRYPPQQRYEKGPRGSGPPQQQPFVKGFGAYKQHGKGVKGSGKNQYAPFQRGKGDGKQPYPRHNGTFSNMHPPTVYRTTPMRPRDAYSPPNRALSPQQSGIQQHFTQQRHRSNFNMNNNDNNDAKPLGWRQNRAAVGYSPFNARDNRSSSNNGFKNANIRHHIPPAPAMRAVGAGPKMHVPQGNNPRMYQSPSVNLRLNIAPFGGGKNANAYQSPVGYQQQGPRFNQHGSPVMTDPHGMRMTYKPLNMNDNVARSVVSNTKQQHGRMLY